MVGPRKLRWQRPPVQQGDARTGVNRTTVARHLRSRRSETGGREAIGASPRTTSPRCVRKPSASALRPYVNPHQQLAGVWRPCAPPGLLQNL